MPETRVATTGTSHGHGLEQHVGDAVAVAVGQQRARAARTPRRGHNAQSPAHARACRSRAAPGRPDRAAAMQQRLQRGFLLRRSPRSRSGRAGRVARAARRQASPPGCPGPSSARNRPTLRISGTRLGHADGADGWKTCAVDAVVHALHPCRPARCRRSVRQLNSVQVTVKRAAAILRRRSTGCRQVDVLGMGRDRERQAAQARHQLGHVGRCCEMKWVCRCCHAVVGPHLPGQPAGACEVDPALAPPCTGGLAQGA